MDLLKSKSQYLNQNLTETYPALVSKFIIPSECNLTTNSYRNVQDFFMVVPFYSNVEELKSTIE